MFVPHIDRLLLHKQNQINKMNLNRLIFLILSLNVFYLETAFGKSSKNKQSNSNNDENNDDVTSNDSDNDSASTLPNSCADLSDGYHWLKLLRFGLFDPNKYWMS